MQPMDWVADTRGWGPGRGIYCCYLAGKQIGDYPSKSGRKQVCVGSALLLSAVITFISSTAPQYTF